MTHTMPAELAARAGTRATEDLPHRCRCGIRWSGANTCHCGTCHLTFVGISAYDRHRKGGTCNQPEHAGMSLAGGRAYQAWTITGADTEDAA